MVRPPSRSLIRRTISSHAITAFCGEIDDAGVADRGSGCDVNGASVGRDGKQVDTSLISDGGQHIEPSTAAVK